MKNILVTGAGGSGGLGVIKSLKEQKNKYRVIGVDCNEYKLKRSPADVNIKVPKHYDYIYLSTIIKIIKECNIDLLLVQTSYESTIISEYRLNLGCRVFLPKHEEILLCNEKFSTYKIWKNAGFCVPETLQINNPDDLKFAFNSFGPKLWLKPDIGSGAIGAISTENFGFAKAWLDEFDGWKRYLASVCLGKRTVTFESIWSNGELIVGQQRERLYWELANRVPSKVTGITGGSLSIDYPEITELSINAIKAVAPKPNGIFGVDITYKDEIPYLTEINAGRFMGTIYFFTAAGVNFPEIAVRCVYDEIDLKDRNIINPIKSGLKWIRGIDTEPILTQ